MCETTSVTRRFLQPLLQQFLEVSDLLFNFVLFTFSTAVLSRTNCASIATCYGLWAREFEGAPEAVCSAEKAGHGVCSLSKGEF